MTLQEREETMTEETSKNIYIVPNSPPSLKEFKSDKKYTKRILVILCSIQILMSCITISSEVYIICSCGFVTFGFGIFCGLFFGICGLFGLITSLQSSEANMKFFKVESIIAAVMVFLILLVYLSIPMGHPWCIDYMIIWKIQVAVVFMQGVVSLACACMMCKFNTICSYRQGLIDLYEHIEAGSMRRDGLFYNYI